MKHKIEIRNKGQHVLTMMNTDIPELALSVSSRLLGMTMTYIVVHVDGEYLNLPSRDVSSIRRDMETVMRKNEKLLDFEIDGLFEV
jgi:hypothetical protein